MCDFQTAKYFWFYKSGHKFWRLIILSMLEMKLQNQFYLPKAAARKREALVVRMFCVGLTDTLLLPTPPPLLFSESLPFWLNPLRLSLVGDLMWGLVLDAVINDSDPDDNVSLGCRQNVSINVDLGGLQLEIMVLFEKNMH